MTLTEATTIALRELGAPEDIIKQGVDQAVTAAPLAGESKINDGDERACIDVLKKLIKRIVMRDVVSERVKGDLFKALENTFGKGNVKVLDMTESNQNN